MNPGKVETGFHDAVICGYRCGICGFILDESHGGYLYLKNDNGVRVPLRDNGEREIIAQMLRMEEEALHGGDNSNGSDETIVDVIEERVGYLSACICISCFHQFGLDLRKDTIECPHCKSDHVRTFLEMTNKRCPKCQSGYLDKATTGNG